MNTLFSMPLNRKFSIILRSSVFSSWYSTFNSRDTSIKLYNETSSDPKIFNIEGETGWWKEKDQANKKRTYYNSIKIFFPGSCQIWHIVYSIIKGQFLFWINEFLKKCSDSFTAWQNCCADKECCMKLKVNIWQICCV